MGPNVQVFDDCCRSRWKNNNGRSIGNRMAAVPESEAVHMRQRGNGAMKAVAGWGASIGLSPPREVYFDFIDNSSFNALADVVGDVGLIALFYGAAMLPFDMFLRMLNHPSVLQRIGDSTIERVNPHHLDGLVLDIQDLREQRAINGYPVNATVARNESRTSFAFFSFIIAFDFLFCHELMHIMRGHLDYSQRDLGLPFMLEAAQVTSARDPITSQALECDADMGAATSCLHNLLSPGKFRFPETFRPILDTPEKSLFVWHFAIASIFYLWGVKIDPARLGTYSHPPPAMRLMLLRRHCIPVIDALQPSLIPRIDEILNDSHTEARIAIRAIGGMVSGEDASFLAGIRDQRSKDHLQGVLDRLEEIKPTFEKYSYFKGGPPARPL
jgi:hypothetical protein